jgi:hypothetical protein
MKVSPDVPTVSAARANRDGWLRESPANPPLLAVFILSLLLLSCEKKEPNLVDPGAMAGIKHLVFANLLYKGEISFVGASEGQLKQGRWEGASPAGWHRRDFRQHSV